MSDMAGKAARAAVECCGRQPRYNSNDTLFRLIGAYIAPEDRPPLPPKKD